MAQVDMAKLSSRHMAAGIRTAHYVHETHTLEAMAQPGYWDAAHMVLPRSTMLEVAGAGGMRASGVVTASDRVNGVSVELNLDGGSRKLGDGGPAGGPYAGQIVLAERCPRISRWLGGWIFSPATDEHILIEQIGTGHIMSKGAMIIARRSQDGGDTLQGMQTLFSRASDPYIRANYWMRLPNGQIIGLVVTGDNGSRKLWKGKAPGTALTGITWAEATAEVGNIETFVYGRMKPLPAIAGGHDTLGAYITSYGGASLDIKLLYTQNAGDTWAARVLKTASGLPGAPQEATLERLSNGYWFMACRTTANGNAWGCIAPPDMSVFGPWIDLGVPLGSNIVEAYADGARLDFVVFYRDGFPGSVDDNSIVQWSALADDIVADPTVIGRSQRSLVCTLPNRMIGYPVSTRRINADGTPGPWSHAVLAQQGPATTDPTGDNAGSGASLVLIRQIPGAVAGVMAADNTVQHITNPTFDIWPRGTSFGPTQTGQVTAGRWYMNPSGADLTVSRVAVPDAVRYALPFGGAFGMRLQNPGSPNDYAGVWQGWTGDDAGPKAIELANRQQMTVRIGGWGTPPLDLRTTFLINGTSALRSASPQFFPDPQGIEGDAPWLADVEIRTKSLEQLSIAEDAVTSCDLAIDSGRLNVEFDLKLAGVLMITGPAPLEVPMPRPEVTIPAVERYFERVGTAASQPVAAGHARTSGIFWGTINYARKVKNPTITVSGASDFHARAGGSDFVGTALSVVNAGRSAARAALTITGTMTTGHGGEIEVVTSPPSTAPFIEISCGR
ncbi:MAG: sialidase family protein [Reyranellaceae bacterium]